MTFDEWWNDDNDCAEDRRLQIWCEDAFEAGRKAGIEEAADVPFELDSAVRASGKPFSPGTRAALETVETAIRALSTPQQEDAIRGTPEAWDTLNKRIAGLDGKEQEGK